MICSNTHGRIASTRVKRRAGAPNSSGSRAYQICVRIRSAEELAKQAIKLTFTPSAGKIPISVVKVRSKRGWRAMIASGLRTRWMLSRDKLRLSTGVRSNSSYRALNSGASLFGNCGRKGFFSQSNFVQAGHDKPLARPSEKLTTTTMSRMDSRKLL